MDKESSASYSSSSEIGSYSSELEDGGKTFPLDSWESQYPWHTLPLKRAYELAKLKPGGAVRKERVEGRSMIVNECSFTSFFHYLIANEIHTFRTQKE